MSSNYLVAIRDKYIRDVQAFLGGEWKDVKRGGPLILDRVNAISEFDAMRIVAHRHNIDDITILEAHELYDKSYAKPYDVGLFMYDVEDSYKERFWEDSYYALGCTEDMQEYLELNFGSIRRAILSSESNNHGSFIVNEARNAICYALAQTIDRIIAHRMIELGADQESDEKDGESWFGYRIEEGKVWFDAEYKALWNCKGRTCVIHYGLSVDADFFTNEAEILDTIKQIHKEVDNAIS